MWYLIKRFLKEAVEFLRVMTLCFISVWVLLLVPILRVGGKCLLFLANIGERYMES